MEFLIVHAKMGPRGGMKISSSTDITDEVNNELQSKSEQEESRKTKNSLSYYKLFSLADTADLALMIVGVVAAISNGITLPLSTVLFGEVIDAFGMHRDTPTIADEVAKVGYLFDN